jgi:autotransporter-associated beta strand protein
LGGNISSTVSSAAITDTMSLPVLLNGTRTATINTSHHLTISGVIGETGGSYGLTKAGSGELTLSNTNNTYSGKTTQNGGRLYFASLKNVGEGPSSLGAPTTAANGTIDISGRMTYTGGSTTSDRVFNFVTGNQFDNSGSGTLTLTGGFTGSGATPTFRGGGTFVVSGLIALGGGGITRTDGGTVFLTNPTNAFTGNLTINDGIISVDTLADAGTACPIGAGTTINIGQANGTTGRFRYTGTNDASCNRAITIIAQPKNTNGGIIENATAGKTLTLGGNVSVDLWTNTPTLQLTGVGNGVLSGVVNGAMRVTVNGSGSWALAGANVYTGATTVSSGTLLINGSTASGSAVSVSAGATLGGTGTVSGAVSVSANGILAPGNSGIGTLRLAKAGATALTLNSSTNRFEVAASVGVSDSIEISGALVLNGANVVALSFPLGAAPAGTYTLMTYASRSGSGTLALDQAYLNTRLLVGDTSVTLVVGGPYMVWQGGLAANAWDTATANWVSGTYADNAIVTFDDTGAASPAVTITPDAVAPFSVTVTNATKAYTFGGAAITGLGGLTKLGAASLTLSNTNTYSGPTLVNGGTLTLNGSISNSSVTVTNGATFTENASGVIAGSNVTFTSFGTATLYGSNTYGGVTSVGTNGTPVNLTVNNNMALGSTAAGTLVNGGNASTESRLVLGNGVMVSDETLTLGPGPSANRAALRYTGSGSGTWNGNIVLAGAATYLGSDTGGTLIVGLSVDDTITTSASASFSVRGSGDVTINSRISIGAQAINRDDPGTFTLNSTSNTWLNTNLGQGTLKLGTSDALPATTLLSIGKNSGINNQATFDLNGKCQTVASLSEQHMMSSNGFQRITSAAPATLIVSNSAANTFGTEGSTIAGAVSLVKAGNSILTLTGTNTTSGAFIVSNGTLIVSSTGSCGINSTNIVVAAGTLVLSNSVSIANNAEVRIADNGGAKVNLASGVNEIVGTLYFGDHQKSAGTYGSTGSGASVTDDVHFSASGSGILTVLHDKGGTLIGLR